MAASMIESSTSARTVVVVLMSCVFKVTFPHLVHVDRVDMMSGHNCYVSQFYFLYSNTSSAWQVYRESSLQHKVALQDTMFSQVEISFNKISFFARHWWVQLAHINFERITWHQVCMQWTFVSHQEFLQGALACAWSCSVKPTQMCGVRVTSVSYSIA